MADRGDPDRGNSDVSTWDNLLPTQTRLNEYFVPKDGIDREVITADICRYLGNDALVRPGIYENPETRKVENGYLVTAYRNLTSAMIEDLKADSTRWDQERQTVTLRENVGYTQSRTHESRQQWGPSREINEMNSHSSPSPPIYDRYPQLNYPLPPTSIGSYYTSLPQQYTSPDSHYVAGSNMGIGFNLVGVQVPRISAPQFIHGLPLHPYPQTQVSEPSYICGASCYLPSSFSNNQRPTYDEFNFSAPIPPSPQQLYPEEHKPYFAHSGPPSPYVCVINSRDSYYDWPYQESGLYIPATVTSPGTSLAFNRYHGQEYDRELYSRDERSYRDHRHRS